MYRNADGWLGWPEEAPFDGIMVTATCQSVPDILIEQLKVGANLIVPIGQKYAQILYRIKKQITITIRSRSVPCPSSLCSKAVAKILSGV